MPGTLPRPRTLTVLAAVLAAALAGAAPASAVLTPRAAQEAHPAYVPDEVVVVSRSGETRVHEIRDGDSIATTIRELERRPEVRHATPNPIAHISAYIPNDPGRRGVPGGWQALQWHLLA